MFVTSYRIFGDTECRAPVGHIVPVYFTCHYWNIKLSMKLRFSLQDEEVFLKKNALHIANFVSSMGNVNATT